MAIRKTKLTEPRRRAVGRAAAAKTESVKAKIDAAAPEGPSKGRGQVEDAQAHVEESVDALTRHGRATLDAWIESSTVVAKGVDEIGSAWMQFAQQSMENGVAAAQAFWSAQTLEEALSLQSDYARASLENLVSESTRISELSVKLAEDAVQPLKARFDAATRAIAPAA